MLCSYLGEALRALLVLEVRQLSLYSHSPCERTPAHLPTNATATRCSLRSASNAHATVVLGGPPQGVAPPPSRCDGARMLCMSVKVSQALLRDPSLCSR